MKRIANSIKEKSANAKNKASEIKKKLIVIWETVSKGEETYNRVVNKIASTIKVFIVSARKFIEDDCLTKSSSIAYTTIISLVPTLTVALSVYSIFQRAGGKKEEVFSKISLFMLEHNIKLDLDPVFTAISGLVENAGKIGGIGAVIMIFTATAMLRSLENSLNDIWRVKKARPLYLKIIYYWAVLTLGPVMLVSATTIATKLSETFSSPHYNSAIISNDGHLWITGSKASLLKSGDKTLEFKEIHSDSIDFENQKVYEYDFTDKVFKVLEYRLEPMDFSSRKLTDIQFIGNNGWIVTDNGIILYSSNKGSTWTIKRFGSFTFNDIHMLNKERGFIACNNGTLMKTTDGGNSWETMEWEGFNSDLNSINFKGDTGIITANRGIILISEDRGDTWTQKLITAAKRKNKPVNLNRSIFVRDDIWLLGNNGVILQSSNNGKTWQSRLFKEFDYRAGLFFSKTRGIVAGEKGNIAFTENAGKTWHRIKLPTKNINTLLEKGKELWAIGDAGMIMVSTDNGKNWTGQKGSAIIPFLINFLAPFFFIWILFLLAYIWLPNTKVPFKVASIGAAFTGAIWVMFILLFIVYIKSFATSTLAIYGALASIPLFLLMVYTSTLIILFGAEVSYTLMHPGTYRNIKKRKKDHHELHLFHGINILHYVYSKFENGKGATYFKELLKLTGNRTDEVDYLTRFLIDHKLLIKKDDNGYVPSNSSANILIADVIDLIHDVSLQIPSGQGSAKLKDYMKKLFRDLGKNRKDLIGDITLKEVIEKC